MQRCHTKERENPALGLLNEFACTNKQEVEMRGVQRAEACLEQVFDASWLALNISSQDVNEEATARGWIPPLLPISGTISSFLGHKALPQKQRQMSKKEIMPTLRATAKQTKESPWTRGRL